MTLESIKQAIGELSEGEQYSLAAWLAEEYANASVARREAAFDKEGARLAGARIHELRKGVKLDLQGMSIREFAHLGHKY